VANNTLHWALLIACVTTCLLLVVIIPLTFVGMELTSNMAGAGKCIIARTRFVATPYATSRVFNIIPSASPTAVSIDAQNGPGESCAITFRPAHASIHYYQYLRDLVET
jgi:hypothetical protein